MILILNVRTSASTKIYSDDVELNSGLDDRVRKDGQKILKFSAE